MFARIFRITLKPGQGEGYTRAIEQKVIPILQKYAGFRDEMAMVSVDGAEGVAISYWDRQEDAEAYERAAYAEVSKILEPFIIGSPKLHKYHVTLSTAHSLAGTR